MKLLTFRPLHFSCETFKVLSKDSCYECSINFLNTFLKLFKTYVFFSDFFVFFWNRFVMCRLANNIFMSHGGWKFASFELNFFMSNILLKVTTMKGNILWITLPWKISVIIHPKLWLTDKFSTFPFFFLEMQTWK